MTALFTHKGHVMKYRVMMFIDGVEVNSSCVFIGDKQKKSEACAKRLSKNAHARISWRAILCEGVTV